MCVYYSIYSSCTYRERCQKALRSFVRTYLCQKGYPKVKCREKRDKRRIHVLEFVSLIKDSLRAAIEAEARTASATEAEARAEAARAVGFLQHVHVEACSALKGVTTDDKKRFKDEKGSQTIKDVVT